MQVGDLVTIEDHLQLVAIGNPAADFGNRRFGILPQSLAVGLIVPDSGQKGLLSLLHGI